MESTLGIGHIYTIQCRRGLANALLASGQVAEAVALLEANLRIANSSLGEDHLDSIMIRQDLADAYRLARRFPEAESLARDGLARTRKGYRPEDPRNATMMATLGLILLEQRKWDEAESVLQPCLAFRESRQPDDWSTFDTRSAIGECRLGQARFAEAEPLIVAGYEGMKAREAKIPAQHRPRLAQAAGRAVRLYEAWGNPEKAAEWRVKAAREAPVLPDLPADPFTPG